MTAEVDVPEAGANGVIIAQGGRFGGWSVYFHGGTAKFVYNVLGIHEFATEAEVPIPQGTHQVRMEFAYDGGGLAKGGAVRLFVDGNQVGAGRVEGTEPMVFSGDETADVGRDTGSAVSDDYRSEASVFNGTVSWVQIDIDAAAEDLDHLITPEERFRIAMARQ